MALFRVFVLVIASLFVSLLVFMTTGPKDKAPNIRFSAQALLGKKIWQDNQCSSCHAIYGLGGHLGPDLTNVLGRRSEPYIRWILPSGKNKMPAFSFNKREIDGLFSYFETLQQSGVYPLPTLWNNAYGQAQHINSKNKF